MESYVFLPDAHHHVGPLPLENKLASQKEEMEQLIGDNHQLASTHVALRQDLAAAHEEIERLKEHIRSIRTESDIQIRIISDKMAKKEGDIEVSDRIKKELQQSINEARKLATTNQELSAKITHATEELEKARSEVKSLPELQAELEKLQKEHQKLFKTFEYEKGLNIAKVENMKLMEIDVVGKDNEVQRLKAELLNAERKPQANDSYGHPYTRQIPPPMYPDGYARPYAQMGTRPTGEGVLPYGGSAHFAWRQGPY